MEPETLFNALQSISAKPPPFSVYTAKALWTDPHTSEQMLAFHLNPEIDVSSRRATFIDQSTQWLVQHFHLSSASQVIDFGCGPGLYTSRLAALGMAVTGIDFSSRSIEYGKQQAAQHGHDVTYVHADYLEYEPHGQFDLITMIMCDICALSPDQRQAMLQKFHRLLSDTGRVVLDVYSLQAFAERQESTLCEKNQLQGFWSASPYYGFVASFKYEDENVSLDKYTIVEEARQRTVYNWLQYFSPSSLDRELRTAGLKVLETYADIAGSPYREDAKEFAVVIGKA